jgi:hypothetical protein
LVVIDELHSLWGLVELLAGGGCSGTLASCLVANCFESTPRTLRSGPPPKYVKTLNRLETSQIPSDFDKKKCRLRFLFEEILNMALPSQSEKCCVIACVLKVLIVFSTGITDI